MSARVLDRGERRNDTPPRKNGVRRRDAFTIIEVLVVIAVIGVLVAMILPAVQASREAGRRTQCKNNLKQLGLGVQQHTSAFGRYPSNGWGFCWVGVPDRGTGPEQPGGWIYNILPYLEQGKLRESGRGLAPDQQRPVLGKVMQTPLAVLACPTRSGPSLSPANPLVIPRNAHWMPEVAKTDYAVNEGDYITDTRGGPATLKEGDSGQYAWRDTRNATGICYQRSEVRPANVRDGAVKLISYRIDAEVHRRLGNRQDGKPVDSGQF